MLGKSSTPTIRSSDKLEDVYLSLAKNAQDEGIDPEDIKLAIETIKAMKRSKKGDY